jgi:glycosyltransferase involved in cell wall biosynthesis
MRPLEILFVQDRPQIQGGAVLYLTALRRYLEGRGHSCRVLGFPDTDVPAGGDIIRIERKKRSAVAQKVVAKLDWDLHLYRGLRRSFKSLRPDVIHLHNYLSGGNAVLMACSGIPTVQTVHDLGVLCPLSGRSLDPQGDLCLDHFGAGCLRRGCYSYRVYLEHALLRESVKRYALRNRVDRRIVHSRLIAERLEAYGLHSLQLPRFVDIVAFPFAPMEESSRRLLFVGYLEDTKGLKPLLGAFRQVRRRVPDARLDIVGDGPRKEEYVRLAAGLEASVGFHGEIPHEDVPAFYRRAAVVAIPSQIPETGPFTALEAMCTGRPVVGSRLGGLVEIVQEGRTGYLVHPADMDAMTERIVQLLLNRPWASRMGLCGREAAEAMSLENPFPTIEALYRELVDRRGSDRHGSLDS